MTPLPFAVTVYSGWVICSRIQIELLSKTVDSFIDWASCGFEKMRLPPRTGPLEPPEPLDDGAPDEPHPASTARALPAIRALVRMVLCLTSSSGVTSGRRHCRRIRLSWFDRVQCGPVGSGTPLCQISKPLPNQM